MRYAETDQMGVVYHSNYIIWFEVGRVEMLRQLGFTYREMEKQDGTHIAVVDVRCRFKAPAYYDDLITIRTRLLNVRDSLLHFGYEVVRDDDGVSAGGRRDHPHGGGRGIQAHAACPRSICRHFARQRQKVELNFPDCSLRATAILADCGTLEKRCKHFTLTATI